MDPISKDCKKTYYPASRTSGTRKVSDIYWIVLHDEEAPNARGSAAYFHNTALPENGGPGGSAHLCLDDQECFRCLPNTAIPWGAASAFGANTHGFHIEQAGYAAWSMVIWKSHLNTLKRSAYKTAYHCKLFNIPRQFVTADELPNKHGITTHAEISKASKRLDPGNSSRYSHTDPGFGWPRTLFMYYVNKYYQELNG
jgi:hypothetical protein